MTDHASELRRAQEFDPSAAILTSANYHVMDVTGLAPRDIEAELIIKFENGYLIRSVGDLEWWMGQLEPTDGSIRCWGQYGSDLGKAFQAL